ncbi:helix-turn-helix domain-containing protein [Draconibacterium halophilum]|uniref:Helix-turn-helix domain-containing protein n=1 Tax=Draconibacterium halophilum TaxID=2706887 RepID=A0A6C0R8N2_9BACT|nr:helix-turn-helix domain-containing protein [Draconibacterium halophilum]QIA06427.1 helix-turn-helix domain-containing protein [Draconibacterium halophilum]
MSKENERVMILSTPEQIAEGLELFMKKREAKNVRADFKNDRITTTQALKLAGVSQPTFTKWVKAGLIKRHGSGNKHFYFKSELIDSLRKMANEKGNEID